MAYGKIKADAIIRHNTATDADEEITMATIVSLDSDKAALTGATFTGDVTLNAQQELRLADSDSSNYIAFASPATVGTNSTWTLPSDAPSAGEVLKVTSVSSNNPTLEWGTDEGATVSTANTWTAPQRGDVTAVTHSSATIAIDFSDSNNFHIQLVSGTANVTSITASNAVAGQSGSIFIQQPASGTAVTFSGWASEYKFPARTPLAGITATLGGVDRVDYVVKDSNEIHCVSTLDMAS